MLQLDKEEVIVVKKKRAKPKHSHIIIGIMTIKNVSISFVTECNLSRITCMVCAW